MSLKQIDIANSIAQRKIQQGEVAVNYGEQAKEDLHCAIADEIVRNKWFSNVPAEIWFGERTAKSRGMVSINFMEDLPEELFDMFDKYVTPNNDTTISLTAWTIHPTNYDFELIVFKGMSSTSVSLDLMNDDTTLETLDLLGIEPIHANYRNMVLGRMNKAIETLQNDMDHMQDIIDINRKKIANVAVIACHPDDDSRE